MVYIILICIAIPVLLLMTLLDAGSRRLAAFMVVGMVMAVCAYEINTCCSMFFGMSGMEVSIKSAPVAEELLKALPILFYALLVDDDPGKVLPSAMAVGIGFAILENAFLLITYLDQVNVGWAVARGISTSLSHGICTLITGCGIIFVRKQKKLFYTGTFGLLSAAITFHATFNLLIQSEYDWIGMFLPIGIYLLFQIVRYSKRIHNKKESCRR